MAAIAVIGVGRMGLPICERLIQGGHAVAAVDVDADRRRAAEAVGAVAGMTLPAAIREASVVVTILPGSPELRDLMLGPDGVLNQLTTGQTWVDMTSTAPVLGQELARIAAARGVSMLDAALGGGPADVPAGTLKLFVGGDTSTVAGLRGVLEAVTRPDLILHMGGAGAGHLTKLLINLLWFGQALAVGEALLLAQAGGLDLQRVQEVLTTSAADSSFVRSNLPMLFDGDYLGTFGLDRVLEELESLRILAEELGVPFELSTVVSGLYDRAQFLFLSDILPTAWQGVAYADVPDGGTLVVFGLGPVGQFAARIGVHRGLRVIGLDLVPERRQLAEAPAAYAMFQQKTDGCIKVVLNP